MAYHARMALLTDIKARSITPGSAALLHGGVTGLSLLPPRTRKGQGKWVSRYVSLITGKRQNAGLGSYPHVGVPLAGKLARAVRDQIALGQGRLAIKETSVAAPMMPSFQQAEEQVHAELRPVWRNAKHAEQWINTLKYQVQLEDIAVGHACRDGGHRFFQRVVQAHSGDPIANANVYRLKWVCGIKQLPLLVCSTDLLGKKAANHGRDSARATWIFSASVRRDRLHKDG